MKFPCNIILMDEAKNDLLNLPDEIFDEYLMMAERLKENIHLGQPLEDKNGKDLSDCYKIYFNNARYRIVYKKLNTVYEIIGIKESTPQVAEVIAIGKRNREQVYKDAVYRLGR